MTHVAYRLAYGIVTFLVILAILTLVGACLVSLPAAQGWVAVLDGVVLLVASTTTVVLLYIVGCGLEALGE